MLFSEGSNYISYIICSNTMEVTASGCWG